MWSQLTSKASVGFILTVQGVTVAILAWLSFKIWKGRNWARITFLAMTALGLPFFSSAVKSYFAASSAAGYVSLLQTALQLVALYLIFARPGSDWFKPRVAVP